MVVRIRHPKIADDDHVPVQSPVVGIQCDPFAWWNIWVGTGNFLWIKDCRRTGSAEASRAYVGRIRHVHLPAEKGNAAVAVALVRLAEAGRPFVKEQVVYPRFTPVRMIDKLTGDDSRPARSPVRVFRKSLDAAMPVSGVKLSKACILIVKKEAGSGRLCELPGDNLRPGRAPLW